MRRRIHVWGIGGIRSKHESMRRRIHVWGIGGIRSKHESMRTIS
jgi:hypothetical protein